MNDINEIKRALNQRVGQVCEHLIPGGKRHGHEYETANTGGGKGRSLKVCLAGEKLGVWADFASGESGDLIDLWQTVRGCTRVDALREACAWMGTEMKFHAYNGPKTFTRPQPAGQAPSPESAVAKYLTKQRGLTREVLDLYRVKASDKGEIVFPYWRAGELIQQKFLGLERDENGKKRIRVEANCEPCLFGWQAIPEGAKSLTICEGEIDALSLWQMGFPAVSVPFGGGGGAKQDWIAHEYERLATFETIYLCMDNDPEGLKAAKVIAARVGEHRCRIVTLEGAKDANEVLLAGGDVETAFHLAKTIDPDELKNARDFAEEAKRFLKGEEGGLGGAPIPWMPTKRTVNFRPGELTIWSGINGHGKSLILGQVLMHGALQTGDKCCIASMEMLPGRTLARMTRQATTLEQPADDAIDAAFEWFGEWLWLFNLVGTAKTARILEVFTYAYRRYGVTAFVVDSLAKCGIAEDDYIGQKAFVERLCDFANEFNVHVHLVIHVRKQQDENKPTGKMDVKGTGAMTDLAFNNIVVWRNKPKEEERRNGGAFDDSKPDALFICDKQRNHDWEGRIKLWYHPASQQFVESPDAAPVQFVKFPERGWVQ